MKVLLFGGTTEGRVLAERLSVSGIDVTVSVATSVGAEALADISGITVMIGRRDAKAMRDLLDGFDICVDATHPYAVEAAKNILAACSDAGLRLMRVDRPESAAEDDVVRVRSCSEAASFLSTVQGRALIATGAKELGAFSIVDLSRLYPRVLPTHEGIAACEAIGVPHRQIIAMQGPFTQALNEALMRQYDIRWLVTKDGGRAGGFEEKYSAAKNTGAQLILVERPEVASGDSVERIVEQLIEMAKTEGCACM